jgi:transcription elongation factor Elf1
MWTAVRIEGANGCSGVSMADASRDTENYLEFACPRCGHISRDEYETLDELSPADWRCESCNGVFNVVVLDCQHCATQTVSVSLVAAEQTPPQYLVCSQCNRTGVVREEVEADIF